VAVHCFIQLGCELCQEKQSDSELAHVTKQKCTHNHAMHCIYITLKLHYSTHAWCWIVRASSIAWVIRPTVIIDVQTCAFCTVVFLCVVSNMMCVFVVGIYIVKHIYSCVHLYIAFHCCKYMSVSDEFICIARTS
jgi:hypothetical protein